MLPPTDLLYRLKVPDLRYVIPSIQPQGPMALNVPELYERVLISKEQNKVYTLMTSKNVENDPTQAGSAMLLIQQSITWWIEVI